MLFSKVFAAGAIMATTAMAALNPQQIASALKTVTDQSQKLQAPAQSINLVNAPLILIGQGPFPTLIVGFTQIVTTASVTITQLGGTAKITNQEDSDLIFDAFRGFVRVHQELLNILIGKAGLLENFPFIGRPVAAVLRQVEQVVDNIAIGLITTVELRAKDLTSEANNLGSTLTLAIKKYDGIQLNL